MSPIGRSSAAALAERCLLAAEHAREALRSGKAPEPIEQPASDVDSLIGAYVNAPDPTLRQQILDLGGAQAANPLTRVTLAARGLCPREHAPQVPAKFLDKLGSKVSAPVRHQIASALVAPPAATVSNELIAPGKPWPAVTGSWGLAGLLSSFGAGSALEQTRQWLATHPLASPAALLALRNKALTARALGEPFSHNTPLASLGSDALAAVVLANRKASPELDTLLSRQSKSGGWAHFEKDQTADAVKGWPIAGVPGLVDVESPATTGRVLEAITAAGIAPDSPQPRKAVAFLVGSQLGDGSWQGINGTSSALLGLAAAGEDDREAHMLRGTEWLRSIQNADGGWGESSSSPTDTAWTILGLLAGADTTSSSLHNGIAFLLSSQNTSGHWGDSAATSWALLAIAAYRTAMDNQ